MMILLLFMMNTKCLDLPDYGLKQNKNKFSKHLKKFLLIKNILINIIRYMFKYFCTENVYVLNGTFKSWKDA